MDAATAPAPLTVADGMPWLKMTFDYMDEVCALIPEDKLDWRPTDPSGRFSFSLGEIAMHTADARRMFARQLAGNESEDGYWNAEDGPSDDHVWRFKEPGSRQAILDSLASARVELQPWLDRPITELLIQTDGTQAVFQKNLDRMQEKGVDIPPDMLRRGPANVLRVLMACACHEAGHRGALQTLLRQQGLNARAE